MQSKSVDYGSMDNEENLEKNQRYHLMDDSMKTELATDKQKQNCCCRQIGNCKYGLAGTLHLLKEGAVQLHFSLIMITFSVLIPLVCVQNLLHYKVHFYHWVLFLLCFAVNLGLEAMNSVVERICDFIHPDHHEAIGEIKDTAAGSVMIVMIFTIACIALIFLDIVL